MQLRFICDYINVTMRRSKRPKWSAQNFHYEFFKMTGTVPNFKLFPKFIEKYLSYNELLSTVAICTKTVLPYKHTACIRRCNDVETTVSTSFKRRIHVVFLQEYFFAFCFLVIYRFRCTCLIICTAWKVFK